MARPVAGKRLHSHRIAGGHRHPGCDAAACIVQGKTESPSNDVLEQYQAICLGLVYWYTNATDNTDVLVNNYDKLSLQTEINNKTCRTWVNNNMGWGAALIDQQITNLDLLKVGIFACYVGNSMGLYKCP
jgi:hypothetical protein